MSQTNDQPRLCTALSQVLVAYAIEFDNEFELRLNKTWARPFLTSIVMWSNVLRYVPEEGISVEDLGRRSGLADGGLASIVGGLERWRYLDVQEDPDAPAPSHRPGFGTARGIRPSSVVRPSITGELAQRLWGPLTAEIDARWRERLGEACVERLGDALGAVRPRTHAAMPRFLPVLTAKGLFAGPTVRSPGAADGANHGDDGDGGDDDDLPTSLSRVLLALTLDYEAESRVSLPIAANLLRVLTVEPIAVGALPALAGVSKEAIAMSATWLESHGLMRQDPRPGTRGKEASMTPSGREAQRAHEERLRLVERTWEERFGAAVVDELRAALEVVLDDASFAEALVTPPGGWRGKGRYAKLTAQFLDRPREGLPRCPMVLHRGGWPDGS